MSPHGSKLTESIRFLANRFLTDQQRKRIKTFLAKMQRIPLKLLGIEDLVNSQREEIERLKSRLTILDGKFSIALYGMPQVDEKYRSFSVTNSFFNQYERLTRLDLLKPSWDLTESERWFSLLRSELIFAGFNPKKSLIQGLDSVTFCKGLAEVFPSIQETYFNDREPLLIEQLKKNLLSHDTPGFKTEYMATDPLTALIALEKVSLDFVLCIHRYQRLVPREQIQLLRLSCEILPPGGILMMVVPNLAHSDVSQDRYWSDPNHLRFYSLSLMREVLGSCPGQVQILESQASEIGVVFRKAVE